MAPGVDQFVIFSGLCQEVYNESMNVTVPAGNLWAAQLNVNSFTEISVLSQDVGGDCFCASLCKP